MTAAPETLTLRVRASRAAAAVESLPPLAVVGSFVALEWLAVLGLALTVKHNGWVYYQGGDQLWYYSLGWLLSHGVLYYTLVGYLWSGVLTPFAAVAGPDLTSALPAIVLFDVLVLLPVAMLAVYGIAARLGGRLFGYWTLLMWLVVPFVGILYTNTGYHQRYTELLLPQGFGLTAMADFPAMVAAVVALYFCTRVVVGDAPELVDAALGGAAAGIAVATKPSAALILAGPFLAFAWRRQFRSLGAFIAALAPFMLALAVWKERGLGYLPLLHRSGYAPPQGVASILPLASLNLGRYLPLDWTKLGNNIDLLREHFWSGHFAVWLAIAGVVAVARRSPPVGLLLGGAYFPMLVVKGGYTAAGIEDGSLFRILMPCYPVFVLGIAALPLLLPHAPRRLRDWQPLVRTQPRRRRKIALGAAIAVGALLPSVAFAAAATRSDTTRAAYATGTFMPVPVDVDMGLSAKLRKHGVVELLWRDQRPLGGAVIYRVLRHPASLGSGITCTSAKGAQSCDIVVQPVGDTRQPARYDDPGSGDWVYRVGVLVNWENSPQYGDLYLISEPVRVHVP